MFWIVREEARVSKHEGIRFQISINAVDNWTVDQILDDGALSCVSWWHNVRVSAMLTLPHHPVWLWSVSALVTIIQDKDPGARCGLGNGHRGNAMSSNVVQVLINDQQTSQKVSSRDHTQDGICVSFVWVPMMIIQHFLNIVADAAPNSRGQTVLIITNDDKKGSETKYNPPFV